MAAELTVKRSLVRKPRHPTRVYREERREWLSRRAIFYCQLGAIIVVAVFGTIAVLTYISYRSFAQLIDQQIAGGYLRSHSGLYAAPRVIERRARLTQHQLATALQRAGYAPDKGSNIWNGSFQKSERSIRILPRQGTESFQWIDVNFDNRGYVSSLTASDGSDLPSYNLEPELLTVDAGLKTGQQETLTFGDIPPV